MASNHALISLLEDSTMISAPELAIPGTDDAIRCLACGHRCFIRKDKVGVCRVRFNRNGQLLVPAGYAAGLQIDPIEKKPFFHVYPGSDALSFGMLGCNYHCSYCQNWITSQSLRDDRAVSMPRKVTPDKLIALALEHRTPVMVSTYNEPLITADWAVEIFKLAKAENITCGFVSNGEATPQVLEFIRPYVDVYKVDLKGFDGKRYRKLGGLLQDVLDTIRRLKSMDFWVEVVTLIVPGFNDNDEEFKGIASFLADVSPDIPWHVTAFRPDYKMRDRDRTSGDSLQRARQIGHEAGLRFVYAGNLPGALASAEDTHCPGCDTVLIRRRGFLVEENKLEVDACPKCNLDIPGLWRSTPTSV